MNQIQEFWQRTSHLLKAHGWTYVQLCQHCKDLNLFTLYNCRSRNHYPSVNDIVKIAQTLDVTIDWLIFGTVRDNQFNSTENDSVSLYLNAPVDVKAIVDRILRSLK